MAHLRAHHCTTIENAALPAQIGLAYRGTIRLNEGIIGSYVRTPLSLHKKFSAAPMVASSNILQHILAPHVATDLLHPVQMVRERFPKAR
jgi:hypothetical protein